MAPLAQILGIAIFSSAIGYTSGKIIHKYTKEEIAFGRKYIQMFMIFSIACFIGFGMTYIAFQSNGILASAMVMLFVISLCFASLRKR